MAKHLPIGPGRRGAVRDGLRFPWSGNGTTRDRDTGRMTEQQAGGTPFNLASSDHLLPPY